MFFDEITKAIITNKLYLESDLTLSKLAKLFGKSNQKISEIINQYSGKNFNDFINHFRVKEAKIKLLAKENKQYTIATIAFDVGFNSLSSFNYAFKKFVGVTPSAFRNE